MTLRGIASSAFIGLLNDNAIQVSMDGKGCWRDNVFVERLLVTGQNPASSEAAAKALLKLLG